MTEEALLDALRQAAGQNEGGDGLTVQELCRLTDRAEKWVRARLKAGLQAGTIAMTARYVRDISGRLQRIPGYRGVR